MTNIVDSKQLLISLMKSTLNKPISEETFHISPPIINTSESTSPTNTHVVLTPLISSNQYGVFTFHYNRMDINDIPLMEVVKGDAVTYDDLVAAIAEKAKLTTLILETDTNGVTQVLEGQFSKLDILSETIPSFNGMPYVDVVIRTNHLSYLFYGDISVRITT